MPHNDREEDLRTFLDAGLALLVLVLDATGLPFEAGALVALAVALDFAAAFLGFDSPVTA
jgi:hypothetical protein